MSDGFAWEGVQVRWGARPRKGMAMEERIVELELRFTEQQRLLQELSEVVYAQGRALERLEHELGAM
ncbi:MAG: SlyX family protein, partial [Myxococcaceae bacterium]